MHLQLRHNSNTAPTNFEAGAFLSYTKDGLQTKLVKFLEDFIWIIKVRETFC